jgi:tyrosyl-tRNA synthetase
MELKKRLAHQIVTELHSAEEADQAAGEFKSRVQEKELPSEIETRYIHVKDQVSVEELVVGLNLAGSKS